MGTCWGCLGGCLGCLGFLGAEGWGLEGVWRGRLGFWRGFGVFLLWGWVWGSGLGL